MSALILFALGYAASIVSGRTTPESLDALHGSIPLPSRYFVPGFLFWSALLPMTLFYARDRRLGKAAFAAAFLPVCVLTFGTWAWQYRQPDDWVREFQQMNAAGYGFLIGASDEYYMARIYPSAPLRSYWIGLMRERRDLMFAKPIAALIGRDADSALPKTRESGCHLMRAVTAQLSAIPGVARLTGELAGPEFDTARPLDVLIADDFGKVSGAGRTIPAATWNRSPVKFLAYYKEAGAPAVPSVYVILPNARASYLCPVNTLSGR